MQHMYKSSSIQIEQYILFRGDHWFETFEEKKK